MTRLGWWVLFGFLVVVGVFALFVRRASVPGSPVDQDNGALAIPVAGVAAGQLTDSWGQSRAEGVRAHHAIDIVAARGTPVLAAAAGTVEKMFESRDGGHTLYIRRSDPHWIDYYAHLDTYAPNLRQGDSVRRGQQIATVGSSGDARPDAPHLHYEIKRMGQGERWWQGTDVNPYPILAGRAAAG